MGELDDARRPPRGSAPGFDEFFTLEFPKMVALASVLTGAPEVGRDVAQESMVKALRDWSAVAEMDRPGAWVRRVTINAAVSWHRSNSRERRARSRLQTGMVQPVQPPEHVFWEAVRALPPRQRAAVVLHHLEDLPVAEVAEILGVAPGEEQLLDIPVDSTEVLPCGWPHFDGRTLTCARHSGPIAVDIDNGSTIPIGGPTDGLISRRVLTPSDR